MSVQRLLGSAAVCALLATPAAAQVATNITPDVQAGFATGTQVSRSGTTLSVGGGVRAGGNLFHSFTTFDLARGDTARWTAADPANVANVINRVTGGRLSTIAGTIDSQQLPNAAFYFINPAGVLMTAGARLNVPGAAYITTAADGVRFADGLKFSTVTPDGSAFSMATPQSFGFLGAQAPIVIDGVSAFTSTGRGDLKLFASDVTVRDSTLSPRTIEIATMGTRAGALNIADPFVSAPLAGATTLANSRVTARGVGGGAPAVRIATGAFSQQGGTLTAATDASLSGGDLWLAANMADIGGVISSNVDESQQGDAGTIRLDVGALRVLSAGRILSATFGAGSAGRILIDAGSLDVAGSISTTSSSVATGNAGLVQIDVGTVSVNRGTISSSTSGSGNGGAVMIEADSVTVSNNGSLSSSTFGAGRGGVVSIDAGRVTLQSQGVASSLSTGSGGAGAVRIRADALVLSLGGVLSTSSGRGAGGDVVLNLGSLNADFSVISSSSNGAGNAGLVTVNATGDVNLVSTAIVSEAAGSGRSGNVALTARDLKLSASSEISTSTFGAGDGGLVGVTARNITVSDGAAVGSVATLGSSGNGGLATLRAESLVLDGGLLSSSTAGAGRGGGLNITAKHVALTNGATIEAGVGSRSTGAGGVIQIVTDSLTLDGDALIGTSTLGAGDAGQVRVQAGNLSLAGGSRVESRSIGAATGAANLVAIAGQALSVTDGASIETGSVNVRPAGDIRITLTGAAEVAGDGSKISSENASGRAGAAGSIAVAPTGIRLTDGGTISTNALTGPAGDIRLDLPTSGFLVLEGASERGVITTSSGPGTGGVITIADPAAIISNGGRILALGQQRGANVQLSSDYFIRSADRTNELSVDGLLVLDSQVRDVSTGVLIPDINFLDASGVLRGQCPAQRNSGATSQLRLRPFGPYGGAPARRAAPGDPAACAFAPSLFGNRTPVSAPDASAQGAPAAAQVGDAALADPTVTLAGVEVVAEGGGPALPRPTWRAGPDPDTGLRLEAPGAAGFDAAWVRRQFEVNDLVGRPVALDRLVALTQLINLTFVRNGYVNSGLLLAGTVPRDGGVLEARLVYGRGGADGAKVRFGPRGAQGLTEGYVRDRMAAAQAKPFDALAAEQQFRRLAQDPAVRSVTADLVPGGAPGEATLEVVVDPAPRYDVYASAANSRSPSIGGERYAVGGSVRNLVVPGDLVTAEAGVTNRRGDVSATYEAPLADPSLLLLLRGGRNAAAVVEPALRSLDIRSRDWSVEGGVGWRPIDTPLTPDDAGAFRPARSLTLGVRLAHREQRTWLLGEPFSFSPGSDGGRSRYTALRLTADYVQRDARQVLALSAAGVQGLGGTHATASGDLDPDGDFRAAVAQASYARRLAPGLELRLRGAAALADGPLYTGERFALGGENTVRGYRENLVLADTGAFGSVELARAFNVADGRRGPHGLDWGAFTGAAFADGGIARNRRGPDPEPRGLASVGASLAWTPSDAIFARVTYAKALKRAPIVGDRDLQDRGFAFRVTVRPLLLFGPAG